MNPFKQQKLEALGWVVGSTKDFLELTSEELKIIEMIEDIKLPKEYLSKLTRYQAPLDFDLCVSQQFVIGKVKDGDFYPLFQTNPPIVSKLENAPFILVFAEHYFSDMAFLVNVWRHSSIFHLDTLKVFSLKDLGVTNEELRQTKFKFNKLTTVK